MATSTVGPVMRRRPAQRRSLATAAGITSRARSTSASVDGEPERSAAARRRASSFGHAHGRQHVRRLHRPAGARRRGRRAHAGPVEQEQQRLALDALDAHVGRAGDLGGAAARSRRRPGTAAMQPVDQAVAQRADPRDRRAPRSADGDAAAPRPWRRCRRRCACRCAARAPGRRRASSGSSVTPSRTTSAPTPFGPPNLWALTDTRSAGAADRGDVEPATRLHRVGVQHGAGRPLGARPRPPRRSGWIVPTSLLASITDTTRDVAVERVGQRVEVDAARARRRRRPARRGARRGGARRGARRRCTPRRHRGGGRRRARRGCRPRCRRR